MTPSTTPHPQLSFAAKCVAVSVTLTTLISIPFLLYGDAIAQWSQSMLSTPSAQVVIALMVVALLVLDIVLPIPSSLVCIAAYALLDGATAFAVVTVGLTLTYVLGHLLGASLGLAAARRIFSNVEMAKLAALTREKRYAAIVLSRPLPVLAEGTSIYLGAIGTPLLPASIAALLSSLGLAAMYGWIATHAEGQESLGLALLASMLVPAVFWLLSRALRK